MIENSTHSTDDFLLTSALDEDIQFFFALFVEIIVTKCISV